MRPEEMLARLRERPVALSIRAPWAHFILRCGKDIENRGWKTKQRGPVLIHQSLAMPVDDVVDAACWAGENGLCDKAPGRLLAECASACGCIIGMVEVVDCVPESDSPWFFGPFGFVLANPVAFVTPVKCKGRLGFFRPDCNLSSLRVEDAPSHE